MFKRAMFKRALFNGFYVGIVAIGSAIQASLLRNVRQVVSVKYALSCRMRKT